MPHIFISAMPQEQALVDEIRLTLEKSYDNLQISVAASPAEIARADLFIYLSSPQAQASPQRQAEWAEAVRLNKPRHVLIVRGQADTSKTQADSVFDLTRDQGSNRALFGFYSALNRDLQPTPTKPPTAEAEDLPAPADKEIEDAPKKAVPPPPAPAALPPHAPDMSLPRSRPSASRPATTAAPRKSRSRFPLLTIGLSLLVLLLLVIPLLISLPSSQNVLPTGTLQMTESALTGTPGPGIEESVPTALSPLLLALSLLLLIGAGLVIWLRGRQAGAAQAKPLVFISYRRDPSWGQARCITNSLKDRGINVFFDVDSINEGKFAQVIQRAIENCDYFVPILAPVTLDSEWVRQEIVYALQHQKPIIPLLVDGFEFEAHTLPAEVREIATHNAINVTHEFYDAAIERLTTRFIRAS